MRSLGLLTLAFAISPVTLCLASNEVAENASGEKRQLLAEHETVAVLAGIDYQLCRGLTALCPKECGQSGEYAKFTIKKYIKYKKHGQYGDPEQATYAVQISDYHKHPLGDPKIREAVKDLKKGDYVLLSWRHDYVTKDGSSSPERPILKLEKIDRVKAQELLKAPAAATKDKAP